MSRRAICALLCLLATALLAGVSQADSTAKWTSDWNARAKAAAGDLQKNPCGDFVFDAWANEFLEVCEESSKKARRECKSRTRWVWERSDQCSRWQDWLLRNHNRNKRRDHLPEPKVRVGAP